MTDRPRGHASESNAGNGQQIGRTRNFLPPRNSDTIGCRAQFMAAVVVATTVSTKTFFSCGENNAHTYGKEVEPRREEESNRHCSEGIDLRQGVLHHREASRFTEVNGTERQVNAGPRTLSHVI